MSKSRYLSILALSAFVGLAACAREGAEGEGDVVKEDTSVVPGQDTISQPAVVPTQDTVVTTVTQDTIEGEARDTAAEDTAAKNP